MLLKVVKYAKLTYKTLSELKKFQWNQTSLCGHNQTLERIDF